jgi:adenine/guanine phosphoribosyltransferase-like PRPP-binding protein
VPHPERLRGRDVLLIDDIYTTGATARACSHALQKAGAATVWVATAARAQMRRQEIRFTATRMPGEAPMHEDVALWDGGKTAP